MSSDKKLPAKSSDAEVGDFLRKVAVTPVTKAPGTGGRLIFALDATASREPAWDRACQLQGEMFKETAALGGLDIQLVYYRGFGECRASKWTRRTEDLLRLMTGVRCLGGHTQIGKVLRHAIKETTATKVDAVVFIGDCMEEDIDDLCHQAGELGLLGVPIFMFHERGDAIAARAFQQIARLSGGAYCRFDESSAKQLRELLAAVAVYAAGGRHALQDFSQRRGGMALQLTHQVR